MGEDLISRQEAIGSAISGMTMTIGGEKWIRVSEVRESLYSVPSAQPDISDRKVGEWIIIKRHEHYPSGKPYEQVQCPFCKRFDNNGDGSFCGYCGALMKGEKDERIKNS